MYQVEHIHGLGRATEAVKGQILATETIQAQLVEAQEIHRGQTQLTNDTCHLLTAMLNPSPSKFAMPRMITIPEDSPAPATPETTAKVVTAPSMEP